MSRDSILDAFKNSKAWDPRWGGPGLPLCPFANNPWIYMAYVDLILEAALEPRVSREDIKAYYLKCLAIKDFPGLINRWPDKSGGLTSHDELMGAAHGHALIAKDIVDYLNKTDGEYNNTTEKSEVPGRFNLFRFPWFIAYMRSRAGYSVNPYNHFMWWLRLAIDYFTYDPVKEIDPDGRLQTWLMGQQMSSYPLQLVFIKVWAKKMQKLGSTPKKMFETYLADCPEFHTYAPDYFHFGVGTTTWISRTF